MGAIPFLVAAVAVAALVFVRLQSSSEKNNATGAHSGFSTISGKAIFVPGGSEAAEGGLTVRTLLPNPRGSDAHCREPHRGTDFPTCHLRRWDGGDYCNRFIVDDFASHEEIADIRKLAEQAAMFSKPTHGGVTLVDFVSGIVSYDTAFASLFKVMLQKLESGDLANSADLMTNARFTERAVETYINVTRRVKHLLQERFLEESQQLYLAAPAFISKITSTKAKTMNDEYWHSHIDTEQYGSFELTTLLYLSNFDERHSDGASSVTTPTFSGGTFDFVDGSDDTMTQALSVPPKAGRLLVFTSGPEHPHKVAKVTSGTRFAMTTAFSCSAKSMKDGKPNVDVEADGFLAALRKFSKKFAELG